MTNALSCYLELNMSFLLQLHHPQFIQTENNIKQI